jgi:DNA-binding transcriptional regulator YdaS (Cro superfamily)
MSSITKELFDEIILHFQTRSKLARLLGVDRSALTNWYKSRIIPPARAIQIEIISDGAFLARDIAGVGYDQSNV